MRKAPRDAIPYATILSPIPAQAAAMLVLGRKEIPARWFLPIPRAGPARTVARAVRLAATRTPGSTDYV